MASFRDMHFTPAEFASIAKIDRTEIPALEAQGLIKTVKRKMGNVDRKMITLPDMQEFFHRMRSANGALRIGASGSDAGAVAAATDVAHPEGVAEASDVTTQQTLSILKTPKNKIQMFYNVKGGTGKSTLTAQYVMRSSMLGLKVLAIDLDGQGHLSLNLDVLNGHELPTVYDVLINDLPMEQAVINVAPGLDLVPANLGLCNIEIPLNHKARREYRLAEAIAKIAPQYDLIVADTNPAASILNSSMLVAADLVNIVCATNPLSFHGMSLVMSTIEEMEREFRRELEVRIIPNMYDNREVISQEVLGELRSQFEGNCTNAVVNRCADLNEATKRRTTVWDVNPKGTAAQDINRLTEELLFAEPAAPTSAAPTNA